MNGDKRFWSALMAVAVVLGGAWILVSRVPKSADDAAGTGLETAPRQGFLAPDLSLSTLDGDTIRLSDLRGRPVLINFWASWCGPCRSEMPQIQAAFERHADELVVLGVNQMESASAAARFVKEFGLTFPIPLDDDGQVSAIYQARALPTSFFVDAQGVIRDVFVGPMSAGLLESKLKTILSSGGTGEEG